MIASSSRILRCLAPISFFACVPLRECFVDSYFLPRSVVPVASPYEIAEPSLRHASKIVDGRFEILRYTNPDAPHPNFGPVLDVQFPPLTRRQFRRLAALYRPCGGRTASQYDAGGRRGHTLLDLLSPMVQATWGCRFVPEDDRGPAPLFYQCYGFVLDVLASAHRSRPRLLRPRTWPPFRRAARERLILSAPDSRATFSCLVDTTEFVCDGFGAPNEYGERDGILPGDLVLVYHDNSMKFEQHGVWLDHLVMYVDGGILLEKSGSGAGTPFRLVDYATFDRSWGIGVFRLQVRRPVPGTAVDVARDLTLGGKYSLPAVEGLRRAGRLTIPPPGTETGLGGLCGAYDDDSGRVVYTRVLESSPLEWDDGDGGGRRGWAKLPQDVYRPLLPEREDDTASAGGGDDVAAV